MARGRLVSRTLGSSRKFAALYRCAGKLAEFSQALYPMLIACSDDFGRMSGDAFTVKHAVFPTCPRREEDFSIALRAMHEAGLIKWYEVESLQVIQIADFDQHQPGLSKRTRSKFPEVPVNFTEIPSEEKRTEGKGIERNRTALRADDDGFTEFWSVYPKAIAKADAQKAWKSIVDPRPRLSDVLAAVESQAASYDWRKEHGKYIPYPATWIRARRWEDELGRPAAAPEVDWYEECGRDHDHACGLDRHRHMTRALQEQAS